MGLSKQEAIEFHRELWNRIAKLEKPEHYKKFEIAKEIAEERGMKRPLNGCFCCEYANQQDPTGLIGFLGICNHCPIDWGDKEGCEGENGLYVKWCFATSKEKFSRLAKEIANLPER